MAKLIEDLLIVIVLFKQRPEQSVAYTSLLSVFGTFHALPEILIYDNSPESSVVDPNVTYIHDPANSGVSKAYNQASGVAVDRNRKWILLLDQDTAVDAQLFQKWNDAVSIHSHSVAFVPVMKDRVGIVSPFAFSAGRGKRIKFLKNRFALDKYRFINSGLFIRCAAFVSVGGYDEEIPLDFSDVEFGERLRKITDHFVVMETWLRHGFSATTRLRLPAALERFHYFCKGAFVMGQKTGRPLLFFLRAFLRTTRLSFDYKNPGFFKIFFQYFPDG